MRNFWDQTGGEWANNTLVGKPAAVFTGSNTQHGRQETTIVSTHLTLLHHGCVIVGLPYTFKEQTTIEEITGGSPYGASTIAGPMGERMPSANELKLAKDLGRHLTTIAKNYQPRTKNRVHNKWRNLPQLQCWVGFTVSLRINVFTCSHYAVVAGLI